MNALPKPKRTLRNEIARHLMDDRGGLDDESWAQLRRCLDDATAVIEGLQSYVLVFGPAALIEAL